MNRTFPTKGVLEVRSLFSRWDVLALPLVFGFLLLLDRAFQGSHAPFSATTPDLTVSLDPQNLPYYAMRSTVRMALAVFFSLIFTFVYGTLAARSRRAERVLIPILDFLQSLPILGFLTATTTIFLGLFRGSVLGLEAVSIFAIFTSQAWNMAFSFYASLTSIPAELQEVARQLRLPPWQKFWKLDVPFATPQLLWNTMMSVSGGWFFVVASEVITVPGRNHDQELPGLGSYIGEAIQQADVRAMIYAGLTLLVTIWLYDQLIFRPIVAWAEKFKLEQSKSEVSASSWGLTMWQRARFTRWLMSWPLRGWSWLSLQSAKNWSKTAPKKRAASTRATAKTPLLSDRLFTGLLGALGLGLLYVLLTFIFGPTLGVQGAQLQGSNPHLTLTPAASQLIGLPAANHNAYLSEICALPGATREAIQSQLTPSTNLPSACASVLVPAGKVSLTEVPEVIWLGILTLLRVVAMVVLATLFWLPVGVWIGLRPQLAARLQPLVQFMAAFPANLVFPIAVSLITLTHLSPAFFLTPLVVLGTQWYILFNVISGALSLPSDLREAAKVQGLRGWLLWKRLLLPAVFPATVTGGITASGGSWNASIVAEVVSWGTTTYAIAGLGAYIAQWSTGAFNPHVALGMLLMGLFVLAFNRLLWHPLYQLAESRYNLNG